MINVTSAMDIRCTTWRLDRNTGAMLADFRFAFDAEQQGKPELHTAFWVAIPLSPTWRLLRVDGNTPDGLPYTDVTASVEASLRKAYYREVMLPGDAVTVTVGVYSLDRSIPPIEELLAVWADPPPVPGDLDHDGRINDMEMLTAVDEWKAGRLGDFQLIGVLENWRQTTP